MYKEGFGNNLNKIFLILIIVLLALYTFVYNPFISSSGRYKNMNLLTEFTYELEVNGEKSKIKLTNANDIPFNGKVFDAFPNAKEVEFDAIKSEKKANLILENGKKKSVKLLEAEINGKQYTLIKKYGLLARVNYKD